jgi:hypothetical protein
VVGDCVVVTVFVVEVSVVEVSVVAVAVVVVSEAAGAVSDWVVVRGVVSDVDGVVVAVVVGVVSDDDSDVTVV